MIAATTVLVGRAEESSRLHRLITAAAAGAGGVVVIVGEPGAGKTRLVEAAATAAADAGLAVRLGHAADQEVERTLGVALDAFDMRGELAHALHFSRFTAAARTAIETDYVGWMITDLANGGDARHRMGRRTSPKVAYIEALDHFAGRFAEHVRVIEQNAPLLRPQTMTAQIRQAFVARELSGSPLVSQTAGPPATLDAQGRIVPNPAFQGSDDEGSVYGCIFLDFSRRVGMRTAVNAYFRSAASGVTTFGGYRTFIANNRPQALPDLDAARQTWGL